MVEDRGEDVVVWMTGTWICNGTGCSLRQGYAARTRLLDAADATLLQGSEIEGAPDGRASYLLVPRAARLGAATAARALHRAGLLQRPLVRPSEDEAGPWWDAGPVFSGRDTIRCPHPDHADRRPSCLAVVPPDGRGGAKCYACDRRFALRIRDGKLVAREARDEGSSLHNEAETITGAYRPRPLATPSPPPRGPAPPPASDEDAYPWEGVVVVEPDRSPGIVVRSPGIRPRQRSKNWLRGWASALRKASSGPETSQWAWAENQFGFAETVCVQQPVEFTTTSWGTSAGVSWLPYQVTRVVIDLDDLDADMRLSGIAKALRMCREIAVCDPEILDVQAVATSPTGVQVHLILANPSKTGPAAVNAWWHAPDLREWLRWWGRWWLEALGRGGRIDESLWHPMGQSRRPGWRKIDGELWWLATPVDEEDEMGGGGYWGAVREYKRLRRARERGEEIEEAEEPQRKPAVRNEALSAEFAALVGSRPNKKRAATRRWPKFDGETLWEGDRRASISLAARARIAEQICAAVFGATAWQPRDRPSFVRVYFRNGSWMQLDHDAARWTREVTPATLKKALQAVEAGWGGPWAHLYMDRNGATVCADYIARRFHGQRWSASNGWERVYWEGEGNHVDVHLYSGLVTPGRGVNMRRQRKIYKAITELHAEKGVTEVEGE